jgi:hypothetical protein
MERRLENERNAASWSFGAAVIAAAATMGNSAAAGAGMGPGAASGVASGLRTIDVEDHILTMLVLVLNMRAAEQDVKEIVDEIAQVVEFKKTIHDALDKLRNGGVDALTALLATSRWPICEAPSMTSGSRGCRRS